MMVRGKVARSPLLISIIRPQSQRSDVVRLDCYSRQFHLVNKERDTNGDICF